MSNLHVVALPHTCTNGEFATCAYTAKIEKFCRMMTGDKRKVILYGSELNTAPCDEHVIVVTEERRQKWFGKDDHNDLTRGGFDWEPSSPWWSEMNSRTIGEIQKRCDDRDLLLLIAGRTQQIIADAIPQLTVAEFGVGYEGIITDRKGGPSFAAFESYSHQHFVYGTFGWRFPGRYGYDCVIPNYFDPADFPHKNNGDGKYLLFVGRLIANKGPHIAAMIAKALDMPLVVAGPGAVSQTENSVTADEIHIEPCQYVGPVGVEKRAELMAGAAALLAPTTYIEPFGGVAVEAMMCGTPAVTFDVGAFTETIPHGLAGYRFHTLEEGVRYTKKALELNNDQIRDYALSRYSLDAVRPLYNDWFDRLDGLWDGGWDTIPEVV